MRYAKWVSKDLAKIHDEKKAEQKEFEQRAAELWGSTNSLGDSLELFSLKKLDVLFKSDLMAASWWTLEKHIQKTNFFDHIKSKDITHAVYLFLEGSFRPSIFNIPKHLLLTESERYKFNQASTKHIDSLEEYLSKIDGRIHWNEVTPPTVKETLRMLNAQLYLIESLHFACTPGIEALDADIHSFAKSTFETIEKYQVSNLDRKAVESILADIFEDQTEGENPVNNLLRNFFRDARHFLVDAVDGELDKGCMNEKNITGNFFSLVKVIASNVTKEPVLFPKPSLNSNEMNWFSYNLKNINTRVFKRPLWSVVANITAALFDDHSFKEDRAKVQVNKIEDALVKCKGQNL